MLRRERITIEIPLPKQESSLLYDRKLIMENINTELKVCDVLFNWFRIYNTLGSSFI